MCAGEPADGLIIIARLRVPPDSYKPGSMVFDRPRFAALVSQKGMFMLKARAACLLLVFWTSALWADGLRDNVPDQVRPIPPEGIAVPDADRRDLQTGVDELSRQIDTLRETLKDRPALAESLSDVQIFRNAVHDALAYNEFFDPREIASAKALLEQGRERAEQLRPATRPGPRPPDWWCAATSRGSTARCSLMAWWCPHRTRRTRRTGSGSTFGVTAAEKR